MNNVLKKQHHRWFQILILVLVVAGGLLIFKSYHSDSTNRSHFKNHPRGDLEKMIGINGTAPEKLKTYQAVTGILDLQHWVTDRGTQVYFVRTPTLPMVDIEVTFDAGAARNENKGGVAYLTNNLLADGTKDLTANEVAMNFDEVGAQYRAESHRDMAKIHLRSLSDPALLSKALKNLAAILSHANFPENGFKREQQKALSTLKQQGQLPEYVASRAFFSALYEHQPYANWMLGTEDSIKALTADDVRAFYQKYYVAKNAVVSIVGDVTAKEADGIAQMLTNQLPEGEKAPPLPAVVDLTKKIVKKVDFPSSQTHILIGEPGLKKNDPDYYALAAGNHILGGNGSVTRIFNTIRNQHGLAYSAYSYFTPMRERGPYVLGCQTRNDQADKAQEMMEALLKEFIAQGPTEKELAQAKQNLLGGYALQFDSNASICSEITTLGFYDLPLNHFNEYKTAVENLTIDNIKQAFQRRISPDKICIVRVGGTVGTQTDTPAGSPKPAPGSIHHGHPGAAQG